MARLVLGQFVAACKGSLRRLGMDQIGIGQLHWSTANYQPLQERALWDGLVALHDQVSLKLWFPTRPAVAGSSSVPRVYTHSIACQDIIGLPHMLRNVD